MTNSARRVLLALLAIVSGAAGHQPAGDEIATPDVDRRLTALTPQQPMQYFELAEELAYEAQSAEATQLAVRLFMLTAHLDERDGGDLQLARSSCIAMAYLTGDAVLKRRLSALEAFYTENDDDAGLLLRRGWLDTIPDDLLDAVDDASEAISLYRLGEGRLAQRRLHQEKVVDLLKRYEIAIGGFEEFDAWCRSRGSCRECGNLRIVKPRSVTGHEPDAVLCPTCKGLPGPILADDEIDEMLQLEVAWRTGSFRSWSSQLAADGGRPVEVPDLQSLAHELDINLDLQVWRGGAWRIPGPPSVDRDELDGA
jgi:hypothetical protein